MSTRNRQQRSARASFTNVAGLGVMGVGSMIFPTLVSMALKKDQNLCFQWSGPMKNGSMTFFCQWVMDNSFFRMELVDAWGMSQLWIVEINLPEEQAAIAAYKK